MSGRRVHISTEGKPAGQASIKVDGHEISGGVRSLRLDMDTDSFPFIGLDMAVMDVSADLEDTRIVVTPGCREALLALGWTPPEDTP